MNEIEIQRLIRSYFITRDLAWPNVWEALAWASTEVGEAYEVLLARNPKWKRNNPEGKPEWDKRKFGEELGDAIMMLVVAGHICGVDPIEEMLLKMKRTAPDAFNI